MKIYLVQGEHPHIPGSPLKAFSTRAKANAYALELANLIFDWLEQPPAKTWEEADKRVQADDEYDDEYDVWITALKVE